MSPTLNIGDIVIVDKFQNEISDFERGDLIVFFSPTDNSTPFVKRIVGFEGEKVEFKEGSLYIDGVYMAERINSYGENISGSVTIPEGSFFVLGDDRQNSFDSRYYGPLREESVYGKAVFLFWSEHTDRIGNLENNWFEPLGM